MMQQPDAIIFFVIISALTIAQILNIINLVSYKHRVISYCGLALASFGFTLLVWTALCRVLNL